MQDIVITGLGTVNAVGKDLISTINSLNKNRSGMSHLQFVETKYRDLPFFAVKDTPFNKEINSIGDKISRTDLLGLYSLLEATRDAHLKEHNGQRIALVFGTSVAGMGRSEELFKAILNHEIDDKAYFGFKNHEAISFFNAIRYIKRLFLRKDQSIEYTNIFVTACSSSANAIGYGMDLLRSNRCDIALCVGSDSEAFLPFSGFRTMLLIDPTGCRPFNADRAGMTIGEAGAALVLEKRRDAENRKAKIYCKLLGFGNSCDAYHPTSPEPEGKGAEAAMRRAMDDAMADIKDIDYINAHGTGTRNNDLAEAKAIYKIFGPKVAVSSTKRFTGHTLGAAGALEALITAYSIFKSRVYINLGLTEQDPEINISLVKESMKLKIDYALSNSFAFGGNNTSLLFGRYEG